MKSIGLFGGSFDPIHFGHLLVAQAAREELQLERLFFVPAAQSPFKPDRVPTSAAQRLRLLRLALVSCEWCEIDEQELNRGGISYTIDTVRDFVRRFPESEIHYLIGADHVCQLHKWRASEELASLVKFAVIPRPGQEGSALQAPFKGRQLQGFPVAVSSSQIRARVRSRLPVRPFVPAAVAEAIHNNGLYL